MAGRRYEDVCLKCVFHEGNALGCHEMACLPFRREDDKEVYYTEVKKFKV
jgi:hypothetical protein